MFLVEKCFVVTVVLLSVVNVKAQSENVPYCEHKIFFSVLTCYNYKTLPPNLKNAKEIRQLRMESQNLEILKNGELGTTNLVNLEALYLIFNSIKTIELGAFREGSKIERLNLGNNLIEKIDLRVFKDLPNLQELSLYSNPLRFSSDAEFPNVKLTELSLRNCKIHAIPLNLFRNLEQLKFLNLYDNQLKLLEWKTLLPLKSLKGVDLMSNPFHCDCQVKFLLNFLDSKNVKWNYYGGPTCQSSSTPFNEKLVEVEWEKIDRNLLVCPPEINSILMSKPSKNQTRRIKLNRHKMISVDCEYEGYPEPNVTWTQDEKPLPVGSGVTIETQRDDDAFPEFNYKFKQTLNIPSSPAFFGSYECHIAPNLVATLNIGASNLPGHSVLPTNFVLFLIVGLLLGVIITFGIYVAVRYSKVKRRQLPKKVYSIIPRESRPNSVPQTEANVGEPPYPPSLRRQENSYEIRENAEVHFYEVPVIPPARLHPL